MTDDTTPRIPIFSTIVVFIIVATMIALGFWQLGRAYERDELQVDLRERLNLPVVTYPFADPGDEHYRYRRLSASCDQVEGWEVTGGSDENGRGGWAHIANCVSASHSQVFRVDFGVSRSPEFSAEWVGGAVTGYGVYEPDRRGAFERSFGADEARQLMIVADKPAPGLVASKRPNPDDEENSSWAYMGQWFLFALTALVIYGLVLRQTRGRLVGRKGDAAPQPGSDGTSPR